MHACLTNETPRLVRGTWVSTDGVWALVGAEHTRAIDNTSLGVLDAKARDESIAQTEHLVAVVCVGCSCTLLGRTLARRDSLATLRMALEEGSDEPL